MKTLKLSESVYQFHIYIAPINLSFNTYLIVDKETFLIQTGDRMQTQMLLPVIKEVLGEQPLDYVFISHFESDECGGYKILEQQYPNLRPLCSEVTARQLRGFGISDNAIIQSPDSTFQSNNLDFKFIPYPVQMHNWMGLILFDKTHSILFSSDVYLQRGEVKDNMVISDLQSQLEALNNDPFLSSELKIGLQKSFSELPISIIAPGHGACIKCL